jgi:hypothetical protein
MQQWHGQKGTSSGKVGLKKLWMAQRVDRSQNEDDPSAKVTQCGGHDYKTYGQINIGQ